MRYVWFKMNGESAHLAKGYKTKGNASKYDNKVLGSSWDWVVAQENPFV